MDQNSTYFFHTGQKCDWGLPRLKLRCQQGFSSSWRLGGRICCCAYLRCWPGLVPCGGGPEVLPPCKLSPGPHSCLCRPRPRGRSVVLACGPLPQPAAVHQSSSVKGDLLGCVSAPSLRKLAAL